MKITEVEPRKEYYSGWGRWAYEVESKDLIKNHWNYSCFKTETTTIAKNTIPGAPNFEPACNSSIRHEIISPTSYQSSGSSQRRSGQGTSNKIFISSLYAKQNNLLPSINHLNQPSLRFKDGTIVTIV